MVYEMLKILWAGLVDSGWRTPSRKRPLFRFFSAIFVCRQQSKRNGRNAPFLRFVPLQRTAFRIARYCSIAVDRMP